MQIKIDEVAELGETILPAFQLDFEQAITSIYTDITRLNLLLKQLLKDKSINAVKWACFCVWATG